MSYLVKIVRDRPPPTVGVRYAPIEDRQDAILRLRQKLIEEAAEYATKPSMEELADVLEMVRALAHHEFAASLTVVQAHAEIKRKERGGFEGLTGMFGGA